MAENIKDNISTMKNLSLEMVTLAYMALAQSDMTLLRKVEQQYDEMKKLENSTTKLIFRIKETDNNRMVYLELIDNIKDIASDAVAIARLAKVKQKPKILKDIFRTK